MSTRDWLKLDLGGVGEQHVPHDLGGHDEDGGVAVDRGVAGEQADRLLPVAFGQFRVLLVCPMS